MPFKMICPKCHTTDYAIERDMRTRTLTDPTAGLIFSCRCGKQLFGHQVEAEYRRQLKEFEGTRGPSTKPASAIKESNREEPARARQPDPAPVAADQGPAPEQARKPGRPEEDLEEVDDPSACAWHPCTNIPRDGSKYCSRRCSNKNARWRYKQRKVTEREAA